jgi:hypothetical protein
MVDTPRWSNQDVRDRVELLNGMLEELESATGAAAEVALAAIEALTTIYGAALARVVEAADGPTLRRLADDEVVGHLLVLHGLHPDPAAFTAVETAMAAPAPGEPALIPVEALLRKPASV